MRSCRISKQVLASLVGTILVGWLSEPISEDRPYPSKMGGGEVLHEPFVMGFFKQEPQCDYLYRPVFHVDPDNTAGRGDSLINVQTNELRKILKGFKEEGKIICVNMLNVLANLKNTVR
ncbi:hypothetical protein AVEN_60154-1 [Araneus ventricosus]|uniref:Uncharacterized protein n=1 Tax=Araneus ventricosus TaxID=182803 RepID=A0A4Y2KZI9_ARAVE|nr:hypothetical protein AVEN_60154-1 [Araneus ventricosus]